MKALIAGAVIVVLIGCGGGGGGSTADPGDANPGGANPGGSNPGGSNPGGSNPGATACTITVSGDAASGVASGTFPCGSIVSVQRDIGAPVMVTSDLLGFVSTTVLMGTPLTSGAPIVVNISFTGASIPSTFTEQLAFTAAAVSLQYTEHPFDVSRVKTWGASNTPLGTLSVQLTPTATALSNCSSLVGAVTGCSFIHGTMHAVMPADPGQFQNHATGTVTIDVTF
jgi:hypothetical protein